MTDVTYFVALPSSLPTMALRPANQPNASILWRSSCARKRCLANWDMWEPLRSAGQATRPPGNSAMQE